MHPNLFRPVDFGAIEIVCLLYITFLHAIFFSYSTYLLVIIFSTDKWG